MEFDLELGEEARSKECVISEMSGQLILCSSPAPNTVYLKSIKKHMTWSCISSAASCSAFNAVHAIFPQLKRVSSVLETTMNNTNPVAHIPLSLFNLTRMDNGEDYLLFRTCVTRGVARVIEEVDNERIAVMQACGIPAVTELDTLNSYWTSKQDCIFDIFHETPEYAITVGPKTLEHRYITEDLPFGVVPVAKLGKILGVQTSCMDAMIKIFSVYLGEDLLILGPAVEDINLARYIENA